MTHSQLVCRLASYSHVSSRDGPSAWEPVVSVYLRRDGAQNLPTTEGSQIRVAPDGVSPDAARVNPASDQARGVSQTARWLAALDSLAASEGLDVNPGPRKPPKSGGQPCGDRNASTAHEALEAALREARTFIETLPPNPGSQPRGAAGFFTRHGRLAHAHWPAVPGEGLTIDRRPRLRPLLEMLAAQPPAALVVLGRQFGRIITVNNHNLVVIAARHVDPQSPSKASQHWADDQWSGSSSSAWATSQGQSTTLLSQMVCELADELIRLDRTSAPGVVIVMGELTETGLLAQQLPDHLRRRCLAYQPSQMGGALDPAVLAPNNLSAGGLSSQDRHHYQTVIRPLLSAAVAARAAEHVQRLVGYLALAPQGGRTILDPQTIAKHLSGDPSLCTITELHFPATPTDDPLRMIPGAVCPECGDLRPTAATHQTASVGQRVSQTCSRCGATTRTIAFDEELIALAVQRGVPIYFHSGEALAQIAPSVAGDFTVAAVVGGDQAPTPGTSARLLVPPVQRPSPPSRQGPASPLARSASAMVRELNRPWEDVSTARWTPAE